MVFLLIMVATGWVWSAHMAEERVHFSGEREREIQEEKLRERIQERVKREISRGCPSIYSRPFRDLPMVVLTN